MRLGGRVAIVTGGARHIGKLLCLAQDPPGLGRDPIPERGEADDAARAFDERYADQRLEFAKSGGKGRLGDETGIGRLAEMAMILEGDQILKLLEGRQVGGHFRHGSPGRLVERVAEQA